jgi:hypothetical protein
VVSTPPNSVEWLTMGRMVVVAAVLLLCGTACEDDEHFPPGEGGGPGGGGGGGRVDAGDDQDAGAADAGDGGAQLRGQLCDVDDVRDPLDVGCSSSDGIDVVELDSNESDETDADGDFALEVDFDSSLVLAVGRDDDETRDALVPVGMWNLDGLVAPRVSEAIWDALMSAIAVQESDGLASIALSVVDETDGQPVLGVDVDPIGDALVFYDDDDNKDGWAAGVATGFFGAILLVDVPAQQDEVTITVGDDDFVIPVLPDHLTWARVEVGS